MVTVILFAVPLSGVIFQTELFDDLIWMFGKLHSYFTRAFPNFHPPAPKLPTTKAKLLTIVTPDQADDPAVDSSTKTSAAGVIANIQVVSGSPLSTSQPTEREEPRHPTHLMA